MEEHTLESNIVYRGNILELRIDKVSVPGKSTAEREIIVHNGAVGILPILDDGSILLVKQYRKAAETIAIEIPAGKIDGNEDPLECLNRELREETGYSSETITPVTAFYPAIGYSTEIIHLYIAENLKKEGEQDLDNDENIDILILPFEEALDMIKTGKIIDSKTIIALQHLALRKEKKK